MTHKTLFYNSMPTKPLHTVRGKIWRGKILANGVRFAKIFHANSYKYSEITEDLPADSPKFSSPFASSVMIRQNFPPPNFSHVRYTVFDNCMCAV